MLPHDNVLRVRDHYCINLDVVVIGNIIVVITLMAKARIPYTV